MSMAEVGSRPRMLLTSSLTHPQALLRLVVCRKLECLLYGASYYRASNVGIVYRVLPVRMPNIFLRKHFILTTMRLLWTTWFVTTVFDARYGHDGVFERLAHAFHLAVMVGFAIVEVSFSQAICSNDLLKSCSYILNAVSVGSGHPIRARSVLRPAVSSQPQLPHTRDGASSSSRYGVPHCGVRVVREPARELFWIWDALGVLEMGAVILHSTFSKTLSFEGTHFNE